MKHMKEKKERKKSIKSNNHEAPSTDWKTVQEERKQKYVWVVNEESEKEKICKNRENT